MTTSDSNPPIAGSAASAPSAGFLAFVGMAVAVIALTASNMANGSQSYRGMVAELSADTALSAAQVSCIAGRADIDLARRSALRPGPRAELAVLRAEALEAARTGCAA